jgi:predicted cupin superfamily sugar epimerase
MTRRPGGLGRRSAREVAERLALQPHREGGFFRETYRAATEVQTAAGSRPVSTSILYLLTEDSPSRFHRLASDELWFYHAGDPAELWFLPPTPERAASREIVGPEDPCMLVPARRWMGARVMAGGEGRETVGWTLVSCVVTPGFEYDDFELADQETLLRDYSACGDLILALT